MAVETPDYTVVEEAGDNIEIRRYPPLLVADVDVAGDRNDAANRGFRILASYIFGENTQPDGAASGKIAMTAPVTQTPSEDRSQKIAMTSPVAQTETSEAGAWVISFVMPSKYTKDTLPIPNDPRIRIRETPPRRAAAIRFSGRWTSRRFERKAGELKAFLGSRGLEPTGPPVYAYYDGPFTPFFLRRNEVIFWLAPAGDEIP